MKIILHKAPFLTSKIAIQVYVKILKRFTGGNKPGTGKKILDVVTKNPPPPKLPTSAGIVTHKPADLTVTVPKDLPPAKSLPKNHQYQVTSTLSEKAAAYVAHKTNAATTPQQTQAAPISSQLPTPQPTTPSPIPTPPSLPTKPLITPAIPSKGITEEALKSAKDGLKPVYSPQKPVESGLFTVASAILKLPVKAKEELDSLDEATPKKPLVDQVITPPPAPPMPPAVVMKISPASNGSHTEQIKELAKQSETNIDAVTIKPSVIKKLKAISGKVYETKITPKTKETDLSLKEFLEEGKKRELLADDPGNTAASFKVIQGPPVVVGDSKNKVKLTQKGQAYLQQYLEKNPQIQHHFAEDIVNDDSPPKFIIITPPEIDNACIIETGLQKHLLVAVYHGEYYAIEYLTSKNSGTFLCNQQIKTFQNQKENTDQQVTSDKKQYMVPLKFATKIEEKDVRIVDRGTEYFQNIPLEAKDILNKKWKQLKSGSYVEYNKKGISLEILLKMLQQFDINAEENKPHPMTEDEIKQQQLGKQKQQAKQAAEKTAKLKQLAQKNE